MFKEAFRRRTLDRQLEFKLIQSTGEKEGPHTHAPRVDDSRRRQVTHRERVYFCISSHTQSRADPDALFTREWEQVFFLSYADTEKCPGLESRVELILLYFFYFPQRNALT